MKKALSVISVIIILLICFGCSKNENSQNVNFYNTNQIDILEEKVTYPKDENGSVEVDYAQQLLKRKVEGKELGELDSELINYYFVNENTGMALVDSRAIGMQKMVSQIYSTKNSGETWELLDDQFFFNTGAFNCIDINDKLVISNFASVTQSNIFIIIDVDGNIDTISSEEVTNDFDLTSLYAEMSLDENGTHVNCNWVSEYNSENVQYVESRQVISKTQTKKTCECRSLIVSVITNINHIKK